MDLSPDTENISADPFASDIFAAVPMPDENVDDGAANDEATVAETRHTLLETPVLWSESLPRVARSSAVWDELLLNLPAQIDEDFAREIAASLARMISFSSDKSIEFSFANKREIERADSLASESCWWLRVAVEGAGKTEIVFQIEDVFAVWLVDAALDAESSDTAPVRALTASETAVLEFFGLNLAHEANRFLNSPLFKFRALSRRFPAALEAQTESEPSPPPLVLELQTTGAPETAAETPPPCVVKIYVGTEALQALQSSEISAPEANPPRTNLAGRRFGGRVKTVQSRLILGEAELTYGELAAVENGDVVLLENHELVARGETLSGRAEIFLGDGGSRKIAGELISGSGESSARNEENGESSVENDDKIGVRPIYFLPATAFAIGNFAEIESSDETDDKFMNETNDNFPDENPAAEEDENFAEDGEQSGLAVENLVVRLRVELEARRMSLAEIGNLRENQILELGIRPTDAVNILIDRQIVGRGELVSVKGDDSGSSGGGDERLGVRITKLMR